MCARTAVSPRRITPLILIAPLLAGAVLLALRLRLRRFLNGCVAGMGQLLDTLMGR
jgi:hypothetical protein